MFSWEILELQYRIMPLTPEQIENGFWYHRRGESFPPGSITYPDQYSGESHLNIECTQLTISNYQQRKLVNHWCQLIPTLDNIRCLWFSSRVNQALLNAACDNPKIEGLWIKWSGIKDLTALAKMEKLMYFHLGTSPSVESIDVFQRMNQLIVLEMENIKKIRDLSPLSKLRNLEGLGVMGSMWTTQIVDSLAPLSDLENLRYLLLFNLKTLDNTLEPLTHIKTLETIKTSYWWPKQEFKQLRDSLPSLKHGSPFQIDLIERFGK